MPTAAEEITSRSDSNLAFALKLLPKKARQDMVTFYAFCRVVDDVADDPEVPVEDRRRELESWMRFVEGKAEPQRGLQVEVEDLLQRHPIDRGLMAEIVRGCEMDLSVNRYETYEDLREYCYRVASAVGLVSVVIFGCRGASTPDYAVELGQALQLTNILRDVAEDLRKEDRIYLPAEDLEKFGVTEDSLRSGAQEENFKALMAFQAERAEASFRKARELFEPADRKALKASELMREIYSALLGKMRKDGFRVLEKRYRLSGPEKAALMGRAMLFRGS